MIKPTRIPKSAKHDPRVYCDYAQLVRIQSHTGAFNFLSNAKIVTQLNGRHTSKLRGRGLNFEELRHYHLGDDIRNLDWKVTLRTGKPHVRGYTEEKDRNVMICIDQRSSMFFASVDVMKSVVACEIAALIGWRVLKEGDRLSCLLLNDNHVHTTRATRSQASYLTLLNTLALFNQKLNVNEQKLAVTQFSDVIAQLTRIKCQDTTIFIISDWHDVSPKDINRLNALQRANDIVPVMITDPMEQALPEQFIEQQWRVGDGDHQLSIDCERQRQRINRAFDTKTQQRNEQLTRLITSKALPLISLSTSGDHIRTFTQRVGGHA